MNGKQIMDALVTGVIVIAAFWVYDNLIKKG